MMRRLLPLLWLILIPLTRCLGQDSIQTAYVDIAGIHLSHSLIDQFASAYIPIRSRDEQSHRLPLIYDSLQFVRGSLYRNQEPKEFVPTRFANYTHVMRFNVFNSADSAKTMWFFPGLYFQDIHLFDYAGGHLVELPGQPHAGPLENGYHEFTLQAHDSMTILATVTMVRTHLNRLRPMLIHPDYLASWLTDMDARNVDSKVVTYVFAGLLLMMVLFSLTTFFQNANPEFLYYSGYTFLLGLMLFIKALLSYHTTWFSYFQEGYLDYIMQSVAILCEMLFMQKFLSTRINHPVLHKLYNFGNGMLILSMLLFTFFHYVTTEYVWENRVENISKVILLLMILVFLIYSVTHWKDKLLRYLFWGNLCLLVFSLLSLLLLTGNLVPPQLPAIFRTSLFYYEIGLFLELVFFLTGLNHKNKRQLITQARERERLKADNQMKEYEKEIAVYKAQQTERERISADMHDELGSGMTAIRLMSEIARNKMKENTPVEIDKISHSADEVLNKMNAIIWSMNSGNDTLDNLVSYIRSYALEYFESTPIDCRISVPGDVPDMELTGDRRRNLFLCIKETLNNALKHSHASQLSISFLIRHSLIITIQDNGVGIDLEKIRKFGNGLKNITKRMTSIGGTYEIANNGGTVTTLTLPLD